MNFVGHRTRQVTVEPNQPMNIRHNASQHKPRPNTVHNIGLHDFARSNDDFNQQIQQAMAQSQRQQNSFFNNPFGGSMFGQGGGFPF